MFYLIPILQGKLRFTGNLLASKEPTDPKTTIIGLGIAILFFIVVSLLNKILGGSGAMRQHRGVFKKKAKELELSKAQIKLLMSLIIASDVKKPLMVLTHTANLNTLLRRSIRDIKKEPIHVNLKQNKITQIYRIKHHLDIYQKSSQIRATHELKVGAKTVIERNDKKSFTSVVLGNYENFFCIKLPMDSFGNQVKWKKGSPVKIIAFDQSNKESHFLSKTIGINRVGKSNALLIAHTIKSSANIARTFQRVDVSLSTFVYPVEKTYDKRNKRYLFKANKNSGRVGKVLDISSGGCSITMKLPFREGGLIELNFDLDGESTIKLQGKILSNRIAKGRKITHIKFTRASAGNLNKINNFIYALG